MSKLNPYYVAFALGSALSVGLPAAQKAMPVATKGVLPIGGDDFSQVAIILMVMLAIASILDLLRTK